MDHIVACLSVVLSKAKQRITLDAKETPSGDVNPDRSLPGEHTEERACTTRWKMC